MSKSRAESLIDLDRYPIDRPKSAAYRKLIAEIRSELEEDGCAVLSGFVREDQAQALVEEAASVEGEAHRSFNRTNPYFTTDDPTLPASHPVRRFFDRSNAFVPADNFGPDSPLRQIYEWPPFEPFVKTALDETEFYRYADPLADVIINVVEPGGGFPWHFDTNNFTVTLAIREAQAGGEFEYCPRLRSATDEDYQRVEAVLDGDRSAVKTLTLKSGDLQLFRGRYTLHRVSPVAGDVTRYVGIFSYAQTPNMVANPERCKQLYGRVLPIHYEQGTKRHDTFLD